MSGRVASCCQDTFCAVSHSRCWKCREAEKICNRPTLWKPAKHARANIKLTASGLQKRMLDNGSLTGLM